MKSKRTLGVLILILTLAFPFRWAFFDIGENGDAVTIASFIATVALLMIGLMLSQSAEETTEH